MPAGFRPVALLAVATGRHEGVELAIADQMTAGLKGAHCGLAPAVFVVPAVGGPVSRLAEGDQLLGHIDQVVGREFTAGARREVACLRPARGRMRLRPFRRALHQHQRQFVDQHGGGFQMDTLVLEAHEQHPQGMVLSDRWVTGFQAGMGLDHPPHDSIDLPPIGMDFPDAGPAHLVLGHVVPAHFVHPGLEQSLVVGVERLIEQTGDPQLVDVQRRWMTVVENHRVAQVVVGRTEKGFLALQAGEQHFGQGPAIVEVIQRLLAGAGQ